MVCVMVDVELVYEFFLEPEVFDFHLELTRLLVVELVDVDHGFDVGVERQ